MNGEERHRGEGSRPTVTFHEYAGDFLVGKQTFEAPDVCSYCGGPVDETDPGPGVWLPNPDITFPFPVEGDSHGEATTPHRIGTIDRVHERCKQQWEAELTP